MVESNSASGNNNRRFAVAVSSKDKTSGEDSRQTGTAGKLEFNMNRQNDFDGIVN